MINIKKLINARILKRHIKYILEDSRIKERLNKTKKEILDNKYLNQLKEELNCKNTENIKCELEGFFEFLIKEVRDLEEYKELSYDEIIKLQSDIDIKNIFIAKPKYLNEKIEDIKKEYKLVNEIIKYESSKKNSKESNKITFLNMILDCIGYDKFSLKQADIYEYKKLLNSYSKPNSKFYKELKFETRNIRNRDKRRNEIKDKVKKKLEKFNFYKDLELLNENMIKEITNIKANNIEYLIKEISKIIKENKDNCIEKYKNINWDINTYIKFLEMNSSEKWSAYHFLLMLGIKTCPYCNRQYITPIYSENNSSVRADLDHFFPKSKYPYLSMSIYNLIPSCKFCNSSLKGDKEFEYEKYLHPYEEGFENCLKFQFKLCDDFSYIEENNIKIFLDEDSNDSSKVEKAKNNAKSFQIEALYNYHKKEVKNLILKRKIYNNKYFDELKKDIKKYTSKEFTKEELLEFIVSNVLDEDNFHEMTLSKLYKDIVEQLDFFENNNDNYVGNNEFDTKDFDEAKKLWEQIVTIVIL